MEELGHRLGKIKSAKVVQSKLADTRSSPSTCSEITSFQMSKTRHFEEFLLHSRCEDRIEVGEVDESRSLKSAIELI